MKEGESQKLTATITPYNATNKSVTWKSSDEKIVAVSAIGEIIAQKGGTVDITATSSNGKTSTIRINVKELPKIENNVKIKTSTNSKNNVYNSIIIDNKENVINDTIDNTEDSNPLGGALALGLLGGGSYFGYRKLKKF